MATLKITHNHENGTVLHGSEQHDGVLEIVQKHGFTWRHWAGIHIRGSRDRMAKTWKINAAAEALRAAGHEVTIEIDNTPRPTAVVEEERKERAEARAERLGERSGKATAEGDGRLQAARKITDGIPFGQPVQPPGHHSRKAHLNALDRADNHRAKACEAWRKGEYLAERAKGVIANQKHREDPRTTMRRIEKLNTEKRDINRKLEGATGGWRGRLEARLVQVDEQITYWQGELDAKAESGEFVPWGPEHFRKGDLVNVRGWWGTVRRVNRKSVSVPWIVGTMSTGQESEHSDTVTWDDISGRRRDGMQWDAPNGEPWPVELAKKMARWRDLRQWVGRTNPSDEDRRKQRNVDFAQRIALGLDPLAGDAEVEAFLVMVDDVETSRRVREAFVDIYDRLAAGEKVPDVQASVTPLNLTPEWRMPDREPEDRIAHRSIFARHDFAQVQAGDLIVGWYDSGRGTPLRRGFCGPVASVSEVNDRREAGEWITITLVGGQETTCQTHRWFAVHPAGTWETDDQAAEPDAGGQVDQLPADLEPAADLAEKVARYLELRRPEHAAHMARQRALGADPAKADEFGAELDAWAERDAQIAESVFGGHLLRSAEIAEVGDGRPVYDGCTSVYLGERYGDRVRHVMGVGWFLDLPTGDKAADDVAEPDQVDQLPAGPDVAEPEPAAEPVAEVVAEPSAAERWQALVSANIHGGHTRDGRERTRRMHVARCRVCGVPDDYPLGVFTEQHHPGTYEEKAAAYLAAYAALLAADGAKRTHPAEPEPTPEVAPPPAVVPAVVEVDVEPDPWGEMLDLLGV